MKSPEQSVLSGSPDGQPEGGSSGRKKRIKSTVKIHDQTQFEAAFDYRISASSVAPSSSRKKVQFQVEGWFFFPPQMVGGEEELTRRRFYQNLRLFMRFKEARYTYKDFTGQSVHGLESPFARIRRLMQKGQGGTNSEIVYLIRICACSCTSWLLKRVNRRCDSIRKAFLAEDSSEQNLRDAISRADEQLRRARVLLLEWNHLVQESLNLSLDQEVRNELLMAEEYCHYRFREGVVRILQNIRKYAPAGKKAKDYDLVFRKWARWQWLVSRRLGLRWIEQNGDSLDQERFMVHLSFLKKRMWQVLYLKLISRKSLEIRKQVSYMLAAGFAALWWFLSNFLIWSQLKFSGYETLGGLDGLLGMSGLLIMLAFVMSYVLKDRIKDLGRSKYMQLLFSRLPDFSEKISAATAEGRSFSVGTIREWVHRLADERDVPASVRELRSALPGEWAAPEQQVLFYRKRVSIDPQAPQIARMPFAAIRDITRFNIRRHLSRLDDPLQKQLCLSRDGELAQVWLPKRYYLDIVLRYSVCHSGDVFEYQSMEANRLVVDKNGLQRIEQI